MPTQAILDLGLEPLEGTDSEIASLRSSLPEPSQYEYPLIRTLRRPKLDWFLWSQSSNGIPRSKSFDTRISDFRKKLVVTKNGTQFFAWVSETDGKIYF